MWQAVAAELAEYRRVGLERLLTEDVVRFATARALVAHGSEPSDMRLEWPHPALRGSRIDLVVGSPPAALIELKYPREPNEKNAAWTMALGEVLKDLYRLAAAHGTWDRVFVYVETARLKRYMGGSAARHGLDLDVDDVVLEPALARALPATAASIIGEELLARRVTARRLAVLSAGEELQLSLYLVDGDAEPQEDEVREVLQPAPVKPVPEASSSSRSGFPRPGRLLSGARGEIHAAVEAVLSRSGAATFTLDEVVREMRTRGSRYAESTVRTMVTSHLCANAPDHASVTYRDFERVGHGLYRLSQP
ncbi:MAG: hypothetical protein M3P93_15185 [Actinomycetota bacterium]|nr:hypothetical protein [Actinomycetota bacterium]